MRKPEHSGGSEVWTEAVWLQSSGSDNSGPSSRLFSLNRWDANYQPL